MPPLQAVHGLTEGFEYSDNQDRIQGRQEIHVTCAFSWK